MNIESLSDIWEAVCTECKKSITEIAFNVWLKDLTPVSMSDGKLSLTIYSAYKKQIVESNYLSLLKDSLKQIMGIDMEISISLGHANPSAETAALNNDEKYTFENFVVGQTNRFAHAASQAVINNPGFEYNPFVIYGPSGVGKTHLLYAIKNELIKKHPGIKIECIRGETFMNQFIQALNDGRDAVNAFQNKYRSVDVLLIDDLHIIAGREQTQEEFFNTFNVLHDNNKQIIVTLDRPPKAISTLEDRIRSRLESDLMADITPADFETRVGITNKKAEQFGITLSEEIVYEIAKKIIANTRQIEGVVKKLKLYIQIENKNPTIPVLKNYIREVINDFQPEPIKIEQIIEEVARTYQVSESEILSSRKTAQLVLARQISMYIARETTDLSYQAIGESFGRDHTTALYSVRKMEAFLKERPHEKEIVDDIIRNLKS
ncbi:MAG: chromosomal replication initiator protein DnaA [Ruminococcaceae bacterium]|nr:chromosomal replication initiator protein DnaA [Oscillospiraceae bacterium]MEE1198571.1 chromosomal replication initiator protein DnaA [Acutalibacteraceae bacterium]